MGSCPPCPPEEFLMVIKCPLVTIHMPRCDLLNVIFARQHWYLWLVVFPNIKFVASIERPTAKSLSASEWVFAPDPLTRSSAPRPHYVFCCTQPNIMVDICPPHTHKNAPCALARAPSSPSFRFLAPPMTRSQCSARSCRHWKLHFVMTPLSTTVTNTGKTVVTVWILAYLFDGPWTANRSTWPNFKGWRRR